MDTFRKEYKELTPEVTLAMGAMKVFAQSLLDFIDEKVPAGREKSLAVTKLEESIMWAVKGLTQ